MFEDLEAKIAEAAPAARSRARASPGATRRLSVRKPLPDSLPRDDMDYAASCACPECGGALRPLGEDLTEVSDYLPGSFRVIPRCGRSCRAMPAIASLRRRRWNCRAG